jgi:hypothetical protein
MPNATPPAYPNRIVKMGDPDKRLVKLIQARLNARGCGPLVVDGDFGPGTKNAVRLFQARSVDSKGNPLVDDGMIGAVTWGALFGEKTVTHNDRPADPLLGKVLAVAAGQLHVRENPPDSNRGPEVDVYLRNVGLEPRGNDYSWCAAFVYWCFTQASKKGANPAVKTAGVLKHWSEAGKAGTRRILAKDAMENPGLIKPGFIFILNSGGGKGHTGLVEKVDGGILTTIEGNTNGAGSREGGGVYRLTSRKIADINTGFIDYSKRA